jgi:hypothetical protein
MTFWSQTPLPPVKQAALSQVGKSSAAGVSRRNTCAPRHSSSTMRDPIRFSDLAWVILQKNARVKSSMPQPHANDIRLYGASTTSGVAQRGNFEAGSITPDRNNWQVAGDKPRPKSVVATRQRAGHGATVPSRFLRSAFNRDLFE